MKEFILIFGAYVKKKIPLLLLLLLSIGIFALVFSLYSLPTEAVGYAALLTGLLFLITGAVDFFFFYQRHRELIRLKKSIALADLSFPPAKDRIERDYQEMIRLLEERRREAMEAKEATYREMVEYYTTWAHQIKTPIAAMRLLLQSEPTEANQELLEQLLRVEQYVEMALQYMRMEQMGADLVIRTYALDEIVKKAVRKLSKSFIRKRIKLQYYDLNTRVLTDEKWLLFVVEQLLTNALKYTPAGGAITIRMDADRPTTLVIADTGIGIEESDLPRVFERGYTGYNGRLDERSTGIGLYLCKRILDKLSHSIRIESKVGHGTKLFIGLDREEIL